MVVLFHARGSWHPIFASGERISMLVASGWLWVHFFFVLSGFVMMQAYGHDFAGALRGRAYWRFIVTRFGRIYPLHLFTLLVMAGLLLAGWIRVANPPGSFAASLVLVQGFTFVPLVWNAPAWSISTEWYVYLLFPLMVPLMIRLPGTVLRVLWLAIALVVAYFFVDGVDGNLQDWPLRRLLVCLAEFTLGCLTHRLVRSGGWPLLRNRALATVVFVAPIVLLALPQRFDSGWLHAVVAVGFGLSIGVIAAEETLVDGLLAGRVLQFLGLISYSIYLDHEILYSLAGSAADAYTGHARTLHQLPTAFALALFALYIVVLISLSWATWRWIEEPSRQWFKRQARRVPADLAAS